MIDSELKGKYRMNRIEKVREIVDEILLHMSDSEERRCAYLHLYGVSQACALLALKRGKDVELAIIAGMLHDIYTYANMNPFNHAHKGAEMAQEILESLQIFSEKEKNLICTAIYYHSDKEEVHGWLDEILKDADVMQHVLYNPMLDDEWKEPKRYSFIKKEFGLES